MSENSRPMTLPPFPPGYRASGILLHVTSLPSSYGIGDVGPAALAWVDRLQEAGQSWWQSLPLGPTGYGNSPYQSLSSFAGNTLLISPDWLIEDELLRASDCQVRSFPQREIDYNAVIPFKHGLPETAWANFSAGARADLRPAYEQFCHDQALLQDLLNLGKEARMNVPGRAEGNWRWRCTEEMLSAPAFQWLRDLTETTNRLGVLRSALAGKVLQAVS